MSNANFGFELPQDMRLLTPDQVMQIIGYMAKTKTTKELRRLQDINRSMIDMASREAERRPREELAAMGLSNTQIMECILAGAVHKREFGEYWDGGTLQMIEAKTNE